MKYLRCVIVGGNNEQLMTGITVHLEPTLDFESAKKQAMDFITQELERYGLDEALRAVGFEKK